MKKSKNKMNLTVDTVGSILCAIVAIAILSFSIGMSYQYHLDKKAAAPAEAQKLLERREANCKRMAGIFEVDENRTKFIQDFDYYGTPTPTCIVNVGHYIDNKEHNAYFPVKNERDDLEGKFYETWKVILDYTANKTCKKDKK